MTTFLEDDFDGSALDGAKWEVRDPGNSWGSRRPSELVVGGGVAEVVVANLGGGKQGEAWGAVAPPSPDYAVTVRGVTLTNTDPTHHNEGALVGAKVQNPGAYFTGWYVFVEQYWTSGGTLRYRWYLEKVDPDGNYHGSTYDDPGLSDGWEGAPPPMPFDMGIRCVGDRVSVLFNDVEVFAVVEDGVTWGPRLGPGVPYFFLYGSSGYSNTAVARISRAEAATIAPATDFWTDFTKTRAISVPVTRRPLARRPTVAEVGVLLAPPRRARVQPQAALPKGVLYREDFGGAGVLDPAQWDDSGALDYYGNYAPGTLIQSGGRCLCPAHYGEALGKQNPASPDYYVEIGAHMPLSTTVPGTHTTINVYARAVDVSHGYLLGINQEGFGDTAGQNRIALFFDRFMGGGVTPSNFWEYFASPNDFVVRLELQGGAFRILLNGLPVLAYTDAAPFMAPGNMGFYLDGADSSIDYLEIGTLAPAATDFWTDFTKTREVSE